MEWDILLPATEKPSWIEYNECINLLLSDSGNFVIFSTLPSAPIVTTFSSLVKLSL